jgi:NADH-quinone oxidoreductase subunit L
VFHLITHAFFKALLFLSSGVVMHAMAGVLDMRQMSGLKRVLPKTNWLMLIGCLALAGCPPFSGFFSKDEIIHYSMRQSGLISVVMLLTAFLTAYYTFRLYFRVFQGPLVVPEAPAGGHGHGHDADASHHAHDTSGLHSEHSTASASAIQAGDAAESGVDEHLAHDTAHHGPEHHNHEPMVMILPLVVLAIGAVIAGVINFPKESLGDFLAKSPSFSFAAKVVYGSYGLNATSGFGIEDKSYTMTEHESSTPIMVISAMIALAGIGAAYVLHLRDRGRAERLAQGLAPLTRLLEAKYFVDEIYQSVIVEPLRTVGKWFFAIDRIIVDGIVALAGWMPQLFGWVLKLSIQRGSLQGYASAMLFGIVIILVLIFMSH